MTAIALTLHLQSSNVEHDAPFEMRPSCLTIARLHEISSLVVTPPRWLSHGPPASLPCSSSRPRLFYIFASLRLGC